MAAYAASGALLVGYVAPPDRHHLWHTAREEEYEHFPQEKLPSCHGGYATDEEHHTLHELSVVELTKAADEGQGRSQPGA